MHSTRLRASLHVRAACSLLTAALAACGGHVRGHGDPLAPDNTSVRGHGFVEFAIPADNRIVALETTLTVPPAPAASGTLFLWPGLQPGGEHFLPIDNGVLQPVLTWGNSCAPGEQPAAYASWWVSAQYVNTVGHEPHYSGCFGGPVMAVNVGDTLQIRMHLDGTTWTQQVLDLQTKRSVSYDIDMRGQAQNRGIFMIESYGGAAPVSDVVFSDTYLRLANPVAACRVSWRGANDKVSAPILSGGQSCYIREISLRF